MPMTQPQTWEQTVVDALNHLGGSGHLRKIYAQVKQLRDEAGIPLSATWKATVRRTCQQSKRITQDVHGLGVWHLTR